MKMDTRLLAAALIFFAFSSTCGWAAKTAPHSTVQPPALQEARKLLDAGRVEECEAKTAEFLRNGRDNADALLLHADALYCLNRFHFAAEEAQAAVALNPNDANAHLMLGKIWQSMRRPAAAVQEYKLYVASTPASDPKQQQYKTLVTVLEEQARQKSAANAEERKKAGDYLNAVSATGGLYKWKNPEAIRVYIMNGNGIEGYRAEFEESLRQAFDEWTELSEGKVKFVFVSKPEDGQMKVTWTNDLHAPALKAEAGHAQSQFGPDGIEQSEISLLTVDPVKDGPIGRNYLYNVCLHEIGHALGLRGHSPHETDIMYPSLYTQQGLSARDVNTLLALYSRTSEQAEDLPYVDEWNRPLTPKAKAERLSHEGSAAAMAGQYQKAIEKLESSLELNPNNDLARKNLAVAANNLAISKDTSTANAIKLLRKALKWDPSSEVSRKNLENMLQQFKP